MKISSLFSNIDANHGPDGHFSAAAATNFGPPVAEFIDMKRLCHLLSGLTILLIFFGSGIGPAAQGRTDGGVRPPPGKTETVKETHPTETKPERSSLIKNPESSAISEERIKPGVWQEEDVTRILPELKILDQYSNKKSMKKLQRAVLLYNLSVSRLRAAEEKIKMKQQEWAGERFNHSWKREERRQQQKYIVERIRSQHRQRALGDLSRVMIIMEKIKNPEVRESKQFLDVQSSSMIQYVKLQFRAQNPAMCIPVLERYITLRPEYEKDPEPHRLLAAGYRYQENVARKMKNFQARVYYNQRKNQHLKRFAELKYGKTSDEYRAMEREIQSNLLSTESQ